MQIQTTNKNKSEKLNHILIVIHILSSLLFISSFLYMYTAIVAYTNDTSHLPIFTLIGALIILVSTIILWKIAKRSIFDLNKSEFVKIIITDLDDKETIYEDVIDIENWIQSILVRHKTGTKETHIHLDSIKSIHEVRCSDEKKCLYYL